MVTDISKAGTASDLRIQYETSEVPAGTFRDYKEYKASLDFEIKANAEGFVRIGYLLKVARDTNILEESGYKSVAEFAQAEYGLTKDVVSRFIAINDRYSIDGYSEKLLEKYEGYGVAKLQEMLTLSDEVIEEINPSLTKREIQEIKHEIAAEETVTPLEVAMEAAAPATVQEEKDYSLTERIWKEFFHENKELYKALGKDLTFMAAFTEVWTKELSEKAGKALVDILAPSGDTVLWSRVSGVGKFMISIHSDDGTIVYTNIRTNEKTKSTAADAEAAIHEVFDVCDAHEWELVCGEEFEKHTPAPEKKPEPKPEKKDAATRQQDDSHKAAATKKYQDEIKAYKEKTGWNPDDPWTPEKGEACEEKEKASSEEVAPAQQSEDIGMNPPAEEADPKFKEYKTRELRGITDVKPGDKLVNIKTGEIADVIGDTIGCVKCATDHGIILVDAPNYVGWAILEEENYVDWVTVKEGSEEEKRAEEAQTEGAGGQQDTEELEDEEGIRGLRQRIFDKEHELEEVFENAYADGFTMDGLLSVRRLTHQLQVMLDKMIGYKKIEPEESEEDDDDSI
jgi:hypothetical protein